MGSEVSCLCKVLKPSVVLQLVVSRYNRHNFFLYLQNHLNRIEIFNVLELTDIKKKIDNTEVQWQHRKLSAI